MKKTGIKFSTLAIAFAFLVPVSLLAQTEEKGKKEEKEKMEMKEKKEKKEVRQIIVTDKGGNNEKMVVEVVNTFKKSLTQTILM